MADHEGEPTRVLRLYVAGDSTNTQRALLNLQAVVDGCAVHCRVEVIDLEAHPWEAFPDNVLVTPILLQMGPHPRRRIIGALDDPAAVRLALGLPTKGER
jgi:circadian clock protein KaiB